MSEHTPGPWVYDPNYSVVMGTPTYAPIEVTAEGADFEGCEINKVNEICTINVLHVYEYRKGNGHHPARKDVQDRVRARANAECETNFLRARSLQGSQGSRK